MMSNKVPYQLYCCLRSQSVVYAEQLTILWTKAIMCGWRVLAVVPFIPSYSSHWQCNGIVGIVGILSLYLHLIRSANGAVSAYLQ